MTTRDNGYVESFNGKLRDELLGREIFYTLWEAKVLVEDWRTTYNRVRPHRSLGYRPPPHQPRSWPPQHGLPPRQRPPLERRQASPH